MSSTKAIELPLELVAILTAHQFGETGLATASPIP